MLHGGDTTYLTVLNTFWDPLSQGTYIFYFLEFQKSRSSGPVLIQTLRGTPKVVYREHKCFKLKILEKGGGELLRILL